MSIQEKGITDVFGKTILSPSFIKRVDKQYQKKTRALVERAKKRLRDVLYDTTNKISKS